MSRQTADSSGAQVDKGIPTITGAPHAGRMSRLSHLRAMRDFIDREIETELGAALPQGRDNPTLVRVADLYGVLVSDILGMGGGHQVTRARHGAVWLLRGQGMGIREAARVLGYRDHSTAIYACRKIDADPAMRALLSTLEVA